MRGIVHDKSPLKKNDESDREIKCERKELEIEGTL